ncbi:glycosyltransferase family 39 protein [Tumebacillus sp. DT12]|uniref:Glycosyltransferase family 39 protein n=1 Tax=Tumebacillus lacus TaxID=2995335 RepID=A0ABT3X4S4_9BACL|nr:glycosyltransferase family 39 protein [Tumebacillus lacus]MCX7571906.1 glycosyltransferase family 39 protein [Tumebacillus lacus]
MLFGMNRRQAGVFWAVFALGVALRVWMVLAQQDELMTVYDDKMYVESAQRLLESGMFTFGGHHEKPTVFIPPMFVLYLSGVFALFGSGDVGLTVARLGAVLIGSLVMLLVVKLASQMGRVWMGVAAAGLVAVFPPLVLSSSVLLTETPFAMMVLLFLILLLKAIESGRMKDFVWAGVLLGLTTLTRPTIALFPIVVGLYLWGHSRYGFKKAFVVGTVLVVTLFAVLSPWIVRNYVHFDRFIPLTKASGNPFLTGTYINNDVWGQGTDPEFPDYPLGWKKVPGDLVATDDLLMEMGKKRLREEFSKDPRAMIEWYTVGKLKLFWWEPFDWSDVLKEWMEPITAVHRVLIAVGFAGCAVALWRRVPYAPLVAMLFVYLTVLQMVYVTTPRYAVPLLPFLFLFVGYPWTGEEKFLSKGTPINE